MQVTWSALLLKSIAIFHNQSLEMHRKSTIIDDSVLINNITPIYINHPNTILLQKYHQFTYRYLYRKKNNYGKITFTISL